MHAGDVKRIGGGLARRPQLRQRMSTCAARGIIETKHVGPVTRARAHDRAREKSARIDDRPPRARFGSAYNPQVDDLSAAREADGASLTNIKEIGILELSAAALRQCAAAARGVHKRARCRGAVLHANARTAKTGNYTPAECNIKASAIDRGAARAMMIAGRGLGGARPADARARRVPRAPCSARSAAQRAGHARAGQSRTARTL